MSSWVRCMARAALPVMSACLGFDWSHDEVARVPSPDQRVDAVLVETNGGATTSFGYEVYVVPAGAPYSRGAKVASLYAAVRSDRAYGANLRWADPKHLLIEYREAQIDTLLRPAAQVAGAQIVVELRPGVSDPSAPGGGMLYNLERKVRPK